MEKNYDEKIDMWGLGCVFAEMILCCNDLNSAEDNFDPLVERYIMSGGSCFPLSPCKKMMSKEQDQEFVVARDDQIIKIIEMTGRPSEEQLCFVTDEDTIHYINSVASRAKSLKNQLPLRFRSCPNEMIDLLIGMLTFNPYFRMSASDCLKSPLFANIRNEEAEKNVPSQVILHGFEEGAIDYDNLRDGTKYSVESLQKLIVQEVEQIQQMHLKKDHN